MAGYDPRLSPELRSNSDDEASHGRDSHDLSLAHGRGRESLLDNLLLSFDKIGDGIGPFGAPENSPYFSTVDEVDDNASLYSHRSRQDRAGSVGAAAAGYSLQYPQRVRPDQDFGYEQEVGSFGVTYGSSDHDLRSRAGRPLESSHSAFGGGYSNGFEYDSAPAPSIRTRNRTPSPPRSPRLVRRPSNKSIKSLRQNQTFHTPEHFALPPLPAFANPPPPVTSPMATPTKPNRPGFFRRVFGGGSNNTATPSIPKAPTSAGNPQSVPPAHTAISDPLPSPPPLQHVITKKSSFFRRRKKSISDAAHPPMPPPPLPAPIKTETPPAIELDEASPRSSSLRNAMKTYIPSPAWNHDAHFDDQRSPTYPPQKASIRAVGSSDLTTTARQSSYYDDGYRQQNGVRHGSVPDGKIGTTDGLNGRSATANGEARPLSIASGDRPSTSPNARHSLSRTFFEDYDDDEMEYMWPQPPKRNDRFNSRATDFGTSGLERENGLKTRSRKPSTDSFKERAALGTRGYAEDEAAREEEREKELEMGPKSPQLNLNTFNLETPKLNDQSWFLSSATPLTATTPTVTLQRDGHDAVLLNHDDNSKRDNDDESIEEEEEGEEEDDDDSIIKNLDIAQKIFNGDESIVAKDKAAAWLGDPCPERTNIRKVYMSLYDWSGINILSALRIFCGRLVFKGEAQQVDRIMDEIAKRWCECNPNHGFKSSDIVHTILYSILLLNTDLHMADIPNSQRMTRGQFLKNTMATIRRVLEFTPESTPTKNNKDGDERLVSAQTMPGRASTPLQADDDDDAQMAALQSLTFPMPANHKSHGKRPSADVGREFRGSRMSRIGNLSPRFPSDDPENDFEMDGGLALVKAPISGGIRLWETQVEIVLKDFYQSIKAQALPLHGSPEAAPVPQSSNSLPVFGTGGMLRRSPSTISKAPSENSVIGRHRDMSSKSSKDWSHKNRSRQRVYNGSFAGSSRTSLEERSSLWSPSASSTWSKYSLSKTQTSMSVDSLGSVFTQGDYHQSIGFANALSHAIIREEAASGHSAEEGADLDVLLDGDDELELAGAPWAKEGLLKHKHHLEGTDKRAKNRNWTDSFAVIQRGYMRLFQFPARGTGKINNNQAMHGVVGGGNWTENAEPIGTFLLRQTLASALPPPGYSKTRPHVWALSLPSGAVHFFEVGTADIVKEFVTTANYWSARLSKEPLIGGVSNVEYGWSEAVIDYDALFSVPNTSPPQSRNSEFPQGRPSLQMSIRSSLDHGGGFRPRLPGDKITIKDWSPPTQSMVASNMKESDQLRALECYVRNIEAELTRHNELRGAMLLAFSPRHPNHGRALNNWEQKSKYLLKEIIKFRTYIDTLNAAIAKRRELVADKLKVPPLPGDEDEEQKNAAEEAGDDTTPKPRKIIQPGGLDMEVAKMVLGNM